ncbi:MAG: hypothetical protein GOVbin1807_151 [Prokaryotic dsDNA virus sp.]|nr:MAG: hypothetical protein GOVbin1807_151 [Prokaryotic dsDNA virus sp.]|tara:strand:- start:1040 stop:1819 length:780 start_codon:yes stop_codon:yes gene_type:complete
MNFKEKFDKFGFLVLRKAFDVEACKVLKETILEYFTNEQGQLLKNTTKNYRDGKQCTAPMAFNNVELYKLNTIFNNKKLNDTLNDITGNKLMFLHHSDAHVDTVAGKGWHTDAINNSDGRQGRRWKDMYITKDFWSIQDKEKYCVIRIALYLQQHTDDKNGLFVRAGSHNKGKIQKELYVKTNLGDVILFDARLQHRGGSTVRKGDKRAAIFWAMGRDNVFSHEHANAAIARQIHQLGIHEYIMNMQVKKILDKNNIGY